MIYDDCRDMDNSKIYFGNDGTWAGSADPAAGSNPAFTSSDSSFGSHQVMPYQTLYADSATYNFGATAFAHTPPTGFKALNTANLPAPTVTDPSDFFTAKTLVNGGTPNTSFDTGLDSIGLIMAKRTDDTGGWEWIDIARGANALLQTNNNDDEVGKSGLSFSGGTFNITTTLNLGQANTSHIVYSLKAGGSPSTLAVDSISSGVPSIASSVSAASHGGFSVGTYTGDGGTSAKTVRHGLSRKPSWVIVKMRSGSGTQTWTTWQENIYAGDSDGYIILSDIAAPTDGASFNGVDVTDEVFSVGNDATNQDGDTFCFWAFAKTPGLIGSGKYIGGGSVFPTIVIDDGASGFKPAWLMIRRIDAGDEWVVFDSTANPHNNAEKYVSMSYNDAQRTNAAAKVDLFSNGFRPTVNHARVNSGTYIYLAFAENPFGGDGVAGKG